VQSPEPLRLTSASADETRQLGERLGRAMLAGDVVALVGPLGSGKTTFAQGIARGLQVPPDRHVASPTFALVNEHPGRVPFVHGDFYRIERAAELAELGLGDVYDRAACALEWADRFSDALPAGALRITFSVDADGRRQLVCQGDGGRAGTLLETLARAD